VPQAPPVSGHSFASLLSLTCTIRSGTPAVLGSSSLLTLFGHFWRQIHQKALKVSECY
jgi:hypothetical protein